MLHQLASHNDDLRWLADDAEFNRVDAVAESVLEMSDEEVRQETIEAGENPERSAEARCGVLLKALSSADLRAERKVEQKVIGGEKKPRVAVATHRLALAAVAATLVIMIGLVVIGSRLWEFQAFRGVGDARKGGPPAPFSSAENVVLLVDTSASMRHHSSSLKAMQDGILKNLLDTPELKLRLTVFAIGDKRVGYHPCKYCRGLMAPVFRKLKIMSVSERNG